MFDDYRRSEGLGVGCTIMTSTFSALLTCSIRVFKAQRYSWNAIRQTVNVTDAQLKARFCASALYHTLILILPTVASASPNESLPEGFDLDPSQCLPVPLMPETSSRFPGTPAETVGELARDFRAESSVVEKMKLEDIYFRVRELAMEELGYEER